MRILVIGGTGFIGSHVVAGLAAEHEVTAVALARTVAWERTHAALFSPAAFDYEAEDRGLLSALQ